MSPLEETVPADLLARYEVYEWRHASAILANDFPAEWSDILHVLSAFRLKRSEMLEGGGRKSKIASALDSGFYQRGWEEKKFETVVTIDEDAHESPTHKVDCVKNRVALEVEWSNKAPFFDRDLNNFRLLFDLGAISVGVIVTKSDDLRGVMRELDIWSKYGSSTTWMQKLLPRIEGGRGVGFCFRNVTEVLLFGVRGSMRTLDAGRRQVNLIAARKREHSRKPDETYDIIESCSPGPYLQRTATADRPRRNGVGRNGRRLLRPDPHE